MLLPISGKGPAKAKETALDKKAHKTPRAERAQSEGGRTPTLGRRQR